MASKNEFFVEVFGPHVAKVVMGEYTVLPNGILQRVKHADEPYTEIRHLKARGRVVVFGRDGDPVVIEALHAVQVEYHAPPVPVQVDRPVAPPPNDPQGTVDAGTDETAGQDGGTREAQQP